MRVSRTVRLAWWLTKLLWRFKPTRWMMNKLLEFLFATDARINRLGRVVANAIGPSVANLNLSATALPGVMDYVGTLMSGGTPTYTALGDYSATQVQSMSEDLAALSGEALVYFQLSLTPVQAGRLMRVVAAELA